MRLSLETRGVAGTGRLITLRLRLRVLRLRDRLREARFDRIHGVNTRGVATPRNRSEGAHVYMPVRPAAFWEALRAGRIDPAGRTFVDLGCGKGAALILAAEAGFKNLVGVELDNGLAAACADNLDASPTVRRAGSRTHVVTTDATRFEFPPGPVTVFLYNPFDGEPFQAVVDNLEQSLREDPRQIDVIYIYPAERHRLDSSPSFEVQASYTDVDAPRTRPGDHFLVYRAVLRAA